MATFDPKDNYFTILGLAHQAPPRAIKRAYNRLVLECHSDKNPNAPPGFGAIRFNKITTAYHYLIQYRDYIDYYRAVHELVYSCITWQQSWMQGLERSEHVRQGECRKNNNNMFCCNDSNMKSINVCSHMHNHLDIIASE